jgi:hypothetical protein
MATHEASRRRALAASLLGLLVALAAVAAADPGVEEAEKLARGTFYEGVPLEDARALEAAGIARLIEMLRDPDEAAHHAQILEVLGMSGHHDAYAAVAATAAEKPTGEVDRDELRKRVAVMAALGHLAREDDRALADLEAAIESAPPPRWRHRGMRGDRLASLLRRSAVSGLALSGRDEAREALERIELDASADPEFERHLREARRDVRRGPGSRGDRGNGRTQNEPGVGR